MINWTNLGLSSIVVSVAAIIILSIVGSLFNVRVPRTSPYHHHIVFVDPYLYQFSTDRVEIRFLDHRGFGRLTQIEDLKLTRSPSA